MCVAAESRKWLAELGAQKQHGKATEHCSRENVDHLLCPPVLTLDLLHSCDSSYRDGRRGSSLISVSPKQVATMVQEIQVQNPDERKSHSGVDNERQTDSGPLLPLS